MKREHLSWRARHRDKNEVESRIMAAERLSVREGKCCEVNKLLVFFLAAINKNTK